jgi:hypothetical protein
VDSGGATQQSGNDDARIWRGDGQLLSKRRQRVESRGCDLLVVEVDEQMGIDAAPCGTRDNEAVEANDERGIDER